MSNNEVFINATDLLKLVRESKTCFNCENCDIEKNICKKFESQPPMKVIRDGCQYHIPDIPF